MEKIREIIRLNEQTHLSERAISRALQISRPIVKQYIQDITVAGLNYSALQTMDDNSLLDIITKASRSRSQRYNALYSQFDYFAKELKRAGVTLQRLWEEYCNEYSDTKGTSTKGTGAYSYSQFCFHFQRWRSASELTMHITHKAGDKMFVDFTGKKLSIVNRQSGDLQDVEVFVSILGASQLTYVEAAATQKKDDWIKVNRNALHYYGGVPGAIVPDCLKSAVNNGNKYEPEINPEYLDFARHYQTTILPARPYHPKDKALVENAVKIVYSWIFASLRNRLFYSLEELNQAIREELEKYNNKPMQKLKISRKQLFYDIEKSALKPLPKEKYVLRQFKQLKAQFNYHIYLSEDKHYYSVPYRFRGKTIDVIYTDSVVELFHKNKRIAFYKRNRKSNGYTTIKEHMPSHHQLVSNWNPQRFINWAQSIGESVEQVVEQILSRRQHPEQAYKVCLGILNLEKKFSKNRLNKACKRALDFQQYSFKAIKNILDKKLEDYQLDCFEPLPEHKNLRGNQYYK